MWRDILKNQKTIAGLNMRSMDLDNIIEEEEDDCKKWLLELIEHYHAIPSERIYKKLYMGGFGNISEEHACFIKEKITTDFTMDHYKKYRLPSSIPQVRHDGVLTLASDFAKNLDVYIKVEDGNRRLLLEMTVWLKVDNYKELGEAGPADVLGENEGLMKRFTSLKKFFGFMNNNILNDFVRAFNEVIKKIDRHYFEDSQYDPDIYK